MYLKNEIQNIIADKRRCVNDLIISARVLHTHSIDYNQPQTIKQQIDRLEQLLNKAEEYVEKSHRKLTFL